MASRRVAELPDALRDDLVALAAVRKTRFKPWLDNGLASAGWALVPLSFDLDT